MLALNTRHSYIRGVKLFGFKPLRVRQWLEVLGEEQRAANPLERFKMVLKMIIIGMGLGKVGRGIWRSRIRTCHGCPLFDSQMKRCRPWTGHPSGCGCYTPFLALQAHGCWGWHHPGMLKFGASEERVRGWPPVS